MKLSKLRIAVVHDFIEEYGGATRVLEVLLKIFSGADLFTLYIDTSVGQNQFIMKSANLVYCSAAQKIPHFNKLPLHRAALGFFSPYLWDGFNLGDYDLVVSSSFGFGAQSVITKPSTLHLAYVHTPQKRLYDERTKLRNQSSLYSNWTIRSLLGRYRTWDYVSFQKPDIIISNSKFTRSRIEKYYRRKSLVIYPPVPIPSAITDYQRQGDYFLCFSRLVKSKGIDLAIAAFNSLGEKLVVVGAGEELKTLRKISRPNIKFTGFLDEREVTKVFLRTKAMVFCALNEDFGITPVQAMTYGVPVIAHASGGVPETVIHRKTGILFDDYSVNGLIEAIQEFNQVQFNPATLRRQAKKFSEERFINGILKLVRKNYKNSDFKLDS